jgi:hypothetical protein
MVVRALANVRSNELFEEGLFTIGIKQLDASQYRSGAVFPANSL